MGKAPDIHFFKALTKPPLIMGAFLQTQFFVCLASALFVAVIFWVTFNVFVGIGVAAGVFFACKLALTFINVRRPPGFVLHRFKAESCPRFYSPGVVSRLKPAASSSKSSQ